MLKHKYILAAMFCVILPVFGLSFIKPVQGWWYEVTTPGIDIEDRVDTYIYYENTIGVDGLDFRSHVEWVNYDNTIIYYLIKIPYSGYLSQFGIYFWMTPWPYSDPIGNNQIGTIFFQAQIYNVSKGPTGELLPDTNLWTSGGNEYIVARDTASSCSSTGCNVNLVHYPYTILLSNFYFNVSNTWQNWVMIGLDFYYLNAWHASGLEICGESQSSDPNPYCYTAIDFGWDGSLPDEERLITTDWVPYSWLYLHNDLDGLNETTALQVEINELRDTVSGLTQDKLYLEECILNWTILGEEYQEAIDNATIQIAYLTSEIDDLHAEIDVLMDELEGLKGSQAVLDLIPGLAEFLKEYGVYIATGGVAIMGMVKTLMSRDKSREEKLKALGLKN